MYGMKCTIFRHGCRRHLHAFRHRSARSRDSVLNISMEKCCATRFRRKRNEIRREGNKNKQSHSQYPHRNQSSQERKVHELPLVERDSVVDAVGRLKQQEDQGQSYDLASEACCLWVGDADAVHARRLRDDDGDLSALSHVQSRKNVEE